MPVPPAPVDFDPGRLGDDGDPYAALAALATHGPVVPLTNGFWAVTGHEAALDVLRHPASTSSPIAMAYLARLPEGAARDEMSHRINFLDPPAHPRVRGLVQRAFTPRRIAALRPWVTETTDRLVQELDGHEQLDLLGELAHQVPSLVISELLGVPSADRGHLTRLSDRVAPLLGLSPTDSERDGAVAAAEEMHAYLSALIDERRADPGDDLLSGLLAAEEDGERLRHPELLSLAATLYSAGHRTTRDLFANGMSLLLAEPSRYAAIVDGTWTVAEVVAELLRFETPTLYVARVTDAPVVAAGVEVPPGTPLLVYLAAANRDPTAYAEPDSFRPGRTGPVPLSFAFGAHYCLGASLARSEAEVMLQAVTRSWPDLALAGTDPPTWHQRGPFRGLDALMVHPHGVR